MKHGQYRRPEYVVWERMRSRCYNPNDKRYSRYGGRGIQVCTEWDDFSTFLRDMGERPTGMTLERVDNDLGYCKQNCRWASRQEQNHNTSRSIRVEHNGMTKTLKQWAESLGLVYPALWYRYKQGVRPPELFAPIGSFSNRKIRRAQ